MTTFESGSGQGGEAARALDGLRILELGDFISGPYCTKLLADHGADVIKVESVNGDTARRWGPFPDDVPDGERSGLYLYLNLGKRSITANIDDPVGRAIVEKLLGWADVLVTNHPAQRLEALALDPTSLQARHPNLVVTTILPYGWNSPQRDFHANPFTNFVASSVSMRIGEPESNPLCVPLSVADYIGGINGAGATIVAGRARRTTGRGQHVDVAVVDTLAMVFSAGVTTWQLTHEFRGRTGRRLTNFNQALYCRDGSMHVIVNQQNWFDGLMNMLDNPEWGQEPEFASQTARRISSPKTQDLFEAMVQAWMADYDREDLFSMSRAQHINMAPYYNSAEVLDLEQIQIRGTFAEVDHPRVGRARMPLPPYKLTATPPRYARPAPILGEHNVEVLCGMLDYAQADLPVLRRLGVI